MLSNKTDQSWRERFKRASSALCEVELDKARLVELARAATLVAQKRMEAFEKAGLWRSMDRVEFDAIGTDGISCSIRESSGCKSCRLSLSADALPKALSCWTKGERDAAAEALWFEVQAQCAKYLADRALNLSDGKRVQVLAELAPKSGEMEASICAKLRAAKPSAGGARVYAENFMSLCSARVGELVDSGLLPAAKSATVAWLEPSESRRVGASGAAYEVSSLPGRVKCMLRWYAGSAPSEPSWSSDKNAHCEFEYAPGCGPGGIFKSGTSMHAAWIWLFGCDSALERDWARFESELASHHAWLMGASRVKGIEGSVASDAFELERAVGISGIGGRAKRL